MSRYGHSHVNVSQATRFTDQDRIDLSALARERLIDSKALRHRAEEALAGYIGNIDMVRNSIDITCRLIEVAKT